MKVEAAELAFIKDNSPKGLPRLIAENIGVSRSTVLNELSRLKDDYNEEIINEARRLLKAIKGLEYAEV